MGWRTWRWRTRAIASGAAGSDFDEVLARAARLGITPDRVLEEYRRIAFANLSHIVHWSDSGMKFNADRELSDDDVAAIAELVESAKEGKLYRVKLYDKTAALDAIARYLGMMPLAGPAPIEEPTRNDGKTARQRLIDELDRLAAEQAVGAGARQSE
jgi:hypothetical protein